MKKNISCQQELNQEFLTSLFVNYPHLIGYGAIYLYLAFYFHNHQTFKNLMEKQNISIYEGKMFLDKLSGAKLVSLVKNGDNETIIIHPPLVGTFEINDFKNKVYQHQVKEDNLNLSKTYTDVLGPNPQTTYYQGGVIKFYEKVFNHKISPQQLIDISTIMETSPLLTDVMINVALEKTYQQCQGFNLKYLTKICHSFVKLNINTIDKAKLYLTNNFFQKVNQDDNLNLLDQEIEKM